MTTFDNEPAVDLEVCMRLVQIVEGGGLTWRDSSGGIRLKDTSEWVVFYTATNKAREATARRASALAAVGQRS